MYPLTGIEQEIFKRSDIDVLISKLKVDTHPPVKLALYPPLSTLKLTVTLPLAAVISRLRTITRPRTKK